MKKMEILQTIFTGFGLVVTIIATVLVYQIGQRQNEINEASLKISNFVEIFLMPQQVISENSQTGEKNIRWNVLIKNVSAYPIYLNSYMLNGVKTDVGSSAIPNDSNSWYGVPIPPDVQSRAEFSIAVNFEDYLGNKYQTDGFGNFSDNWWSIRSKKRIEIR